MNLSKARNWATPLTIGTFFISGISGILLLFKINLGISREIHEWIGILMVLGVIIHVISNWKAFKNYFTKPIGLTIMGIFLVFAILTFVAPGESEGGTSPMHIFQTMQNIPLTTAAQVVKTDPEMIKAKLEEKGLVVNNTNQTIREIATANGKNPMNVLRVVFDNGIQNRGNSSPEKSID